MILSKEDFLQIYANICNIGRIEFLTKDCQKWLNLFFEFSSFVYGEYMLECLKKQFNSELVDKALKEYLSSFL